MTARHTGLAEVPCRRCTAPAVVVRTVLPCGCALWLGECDPCAGAPVSYGLHKYGCPDAIDALDLPHGRGTPYRGPTQQMPLL